MPLFTRQPIGANLDQINQTSDRSTALKLATNDELATLTSWLELWTLAVDREIEHRVKEPPQC